MCDLFTFLPSFIAHIVKPKTDYRVIKQLTIIPHTVLLMHGIRGGIMTSCVKTLHTKKTTLSVMVQSRRKNNKKFLTEA